MRMLGNENEMKCIVHSQTLLFFNLFYISHSPAFPIIYSVACVVLYWRAYMRYECCTINIFLCEGLGLGSFEIRLTQFRGTKQFRVYATEL